MKESLTIIKHEITKYFFARMFPQMTKCCHTDDITFKLWQPLPPYIMDKDGHRFACHIL